ncbi:DUF4373 domain-containing protein [Hungatella hathewayi]
MIDTPPGAPRSRGLDYFPKMVNFYEDDKIFDLLDEYGPLGTTIYDCILTIVYTNGYYANLSKDKLSRMVIRKIGNKWIKNQKVVVQVIDYCADLGLLCKDLMLQDIITSVGIQKRYYKIAVKLMKRRLYSTQYWLLDENGEPLLNSPKTQIDSEENRIVSEEINQSSEEIPPINKSKEKETKTIRERSFVSEENLNQAILRYIEHREQLKKPMTEDAISMLLAELMKLGSSTDERVEILNRSVMNGWVGIFPLKEREKDKGKGNQFQQFPQRDIDYDAIVMQQLQEGQDVDKKSG